ncbi:zona pellucida sperm-binding protein 2 [Discoglossus pictus]
MGVPVYLINPAMIARIFLFGCSLFVPSDSALLQDFPGSVSCHDHEIMLRKPKGVRWSAWQKLHVVDSTGVQILGCGDLVNSKKLVIPDKCIKEEEGRRVLYLAFNETAEWNTLIYRVVCNDVQADDILGGPVVNCSQDFMSVTFPRTLSPFEDEGVFAPIQPYYWTLTITDNTQTLKLNVKQAKDNGYVLTSDASNLMVRAYYNATGIKLLTMNNQNLYKGNLKLSYQTRTPNIVVEASMICYQGPPTCNDTHMTIIMPAFGGTLIGVTLNNVDIPFSTYALQRNGITLDTRNGFRFYIDKNFMKMDIKTGGYTRYYASLILLFRVDGTTIPMLITPECPASHNPVSTLCSQDGYMTIEVLAAATQPILNLDTVRLADGKCQPTTRTNSMLIYNVPLNSCGTMLKFVGNKVIYENEIHALWKDSPPSRISRDSEYRLTIQCSYDSSAAATMIVNVVTGPTLASAKTNGPLSLVLNMFQDNSYTTMYGIGQYPVVKTLRDPIYLEVQLLNRNDPNLKLVLDDCWATTSQDPNSLPQWKVVVDGCKAPQDNYQTVFHPVYGVALPSYRKRFEVKTFAFVSNGQASTNLIYFYCSAVVCNTLAPDSPLCSKTCTMSRKRRDEIHTDKDSTLVSLPGPIIILEAEKSLRYEDLHNDDVDHLAVGLLSVIVVIAVSVLAVILLSVFKWNSKCGRP